MENPKKYAIRGLYTYICKKNDSVYVGCDNDIWARVLDDMKRFPKRTHWCKPMQADWNRHGKAGFACKIVKVVPNYTIVNDRPYDLHLVEEREKYIKTLLDQGIRVYNEIQDEMHMKIKLNINTFNKLE